MDNITIGQVFDFFKSIIEVAGIIGAVYVLLMKGIKKLLEPISEGLKKEKMQRLKSELTTFMYLAENNSISNEQKMLAHEEYDDYIENGGNSYIKTKYQKLVKEGKL